MLQQIKVPHNPATMPKVPIQIVEAAVMEAATAEAKAKATVIAAVVAEIAV